MNVEEKDRLIEILFYQYFNNISSTKIGTTDFWGTIKGICFIYGIDNLSVSKAIRLLMSDENRPVEIETYYLLDSLGVSVRNINSISGIYWQKQVKLKEEFQTNPPVIRRRINDVVMKYSMRKFIDAIYDFTGIFKRISYNLLETILGG